MGIGIAVLAAGVIGLALAALLLRSEPRGNRIAVLVGAAGGFLLALLLALALGVSALGALATATLGAAALALVVTGQLRLFRNVGQGAK